MCFYIAHVSSPLDRSKRFTLFLPWQTCSFRHLLDFSWKHSSHAEDNSITFPPHSKARYSFTQLIELGCWAENENANILKRYHFRGFEPRSKEDSDPGSLCILLLSHRTPQNNESLDSYKPHFFAPSHVNCAVCRP